MNLEMNTNEHQVKTLIMYARTIPCPFVSLARRVLESKGVPYRELFIDQNGTYHQRVVEWTGFLSVPTLVAAYENEELPYSEPTPLDKGTSPRGINRGSMITEPNEEELTIWLQQNGLLEPTAQP